MLITLSFLSDISTVFIFYIIITKIFISNWLLISISIPVIFCVFGTIKITKKIKNKKKFTKNTKKSKNTKFLEKEKKGKKKEKKREKEKHFFVRKQTQKI